MEELKTAESVCFYIKNENNGQRGSMMYYTVLKNQAFCPVQSLTTHTHYLYSIAPNDDSLPISYISHTHHIITAHITLVAIGEIKKVS
jgi:hypothetical protein